MVLRPTLGRTARDALRRSLDKSWALHDMNIGRCLLHVTENVPAGYNSICFHPDGAPDTQELGISRGGPELRPAEHCKGSPRAQSDHEYNLTAYKLLLAHVRTDSPEQ